MSAKNPYPPMSLDYWKFKRDAVLHLNVSAGERRAAMDKLKIELVEAMASFEFQTHKSDCGPVAVATLLCPPKTPRKPKKPAPLTPETAPEAFETMKVSE